MYSERSRSLVCWMQILASYLLFIMAEGYDKGVPQASGMQSSQGSETEQLIIGITGLPKNHRRRPGFFISFLRGEVEMGKVIRRLKIGGKAVAMICLGFIALSTFPSTIYGGSNTATLAVTATISGVNSLELTFFNLADDQPASKVQFTNTSGIVKANQYIRINFDSNALGAKIILRTDNRNSNPAFTGTGEGAGLVGVADSTVTIPMLWVVFPDLPSAKSFQFTGDTDPDVNATGSLPGANRRPSGEAEGIVVDKANPNFEIPNVLNYATVVLPNGTNGLLANFPTDEDGAGPSTALRQASSPLFLVLGADFVNAKTQSYTTTTLGFDLVVQ